uniref:Uncharacterized protein n=1 Tax=Arundo donax TaxID=35708 RepID=A0A0A9H631_ARUDO
MDCVTIDHTRKFNHFKVSLLENLLFFYLWAKRSVIEVLLFVEWFGCTFHQEHQ